MNMCHSTLICLLLICILLNQQISAFRGSSCLLRHEIQTISRRNRFISLNMSGKGFGKKKIDEKDASIVNDQSVGSDGTETTTLSATESDVELNTKAIENDPSKAILQTKMFKSMKKKEDEELQRKIKELEEEEALIASDPSVGAVPQIVADRMIVRIAGFFGIPVFGGLAIFVGAFFASKNYDFTIPPNVIAYATQVPFVAGLLGISYAILSSSWDEEPGSFWGFEEFQINFKRIQEGFAREKQNAKLKEEIEKSKGKRVL